MPKVRKAVDLEFSRTVKIAFLLIARLTQSNFFGVTTDNSKTLKAIAIGSGGGGLLLILLVIPIVVFILRRK